MQQNKICFLPYFTFPVVLLSVIASFAESTRGQQLLLKTETFDVDPGWDGRNNRASDPEPRQIVQNFGFDPSSSNAGGPAGEIGGFITPAGEPAYYGKVISPKSFNDPLSASGILNVPQGGGHTLIGFFNADTVNEWRTPNTIALRIYGRGTYFLRVSRVWHWLVASWRRRRSAERRPFQAAQPTTRSRSTTIPTALVVSGHGHRHVRQSTRPS